MAKSFLRSVPADAGTVDTLGLQDLKIAIILPCYNEEASIAQVVQEFRAALPQADIFVCDNNSSDRTAEIARAAGAVVLHESYQGKGNAVRRLFSDVEADIYVMADGDATYDAEAAPRMISRLVEDRLAMVSGARVSEHEDAYRFGHKFGNWMLTGLVRMSFGDRFRDMLSGYRVMSRQFVKSFPALSNGFEIETELCVHSLRLQLPVIEMDTAYRARPEGSASKLSTVRDGIRILRMISRLVRDEKPLEFFSTVAALLFLMASILIIPILITYVETGLVPRFPTLFVAMGIFGISMLSLSVGLTLDTLSRGRTEVRRLAYLAASSYRKDHY
ncbi:MAG: glycosyltransferase [Alphaproteobacteria bacterium]|nr:glycosyltransferase [Alphaproteobacteria bacterium]|tara:strand:+ start:797 stop:1792 length:996 start_codon:yes stop_codon:yes gene_type:complete